MSIFVDDPIFPFRDKMYCHMATDGDINELHEFAEKIGMKRSWFQNHPQHPHYDLSPTMRARAVENGAIQISSLEMVSMFKRKWEKARV